MRRAPRSSLLVLLLLLLAGPRAWGVPPQAATKQDMRVAEQARAAELAAQKDAAARATAAAAEEQRLTDARIAAAEQLRVTETATAAAAVRIDALASRRREAEAQLARRAETMLPLLPLIERLSLYPAETMLAIPAPPEDRLRGVLVLRGLSRQLETEAASLRRDRAALDAATAAIEAEAPKLAAAVAAQADRAAELDRLIEETRTQRRTAESDAETAAQRAAAEAARADSLRAALIALEAQRKAEEARAHEEALRAERRKNAEEAEAARRREAALARPAASLSQPGQPKGQLLTPVAGVITRGFGSPTEAGPATGLSYQAPPNARVIAPCRGRVAFADRFRTYGQLLIIDCGGGYHAVLSGLERLDARTGQTIQAGEPVGTMPAWQPGAAGPRPALNVELRHDGHPVDPALWLRGAG